MNKLLIAISFIIIHCYSTNQTKIPTDLESMKVDTPEQKELNSENAESFLNDLKKGIEKKNHYSNNYQWKLTKEGITKPFRILYYFLVPKNTPEDSNLNLFRFEVFQSLQLHTDIILDRSLNLYDDRWNRCEEFKKCKPILGQKISSDSTDIPVVLWFRFEQDPKDKKLYNVDYYICSEINNYCKDTKEERLDGSSKESILNLFTANMLIHLNELHKRKTENNLWDWEFKRVTDL